MEHLLYLISLSFIILAVSMQRRWYKEDRSELTYSILISCRNESPNLPALFQALEKIDYPEDKYEIIIADDASTDDSLQLLQNYSSSRSNVTILPLTYKNKNYKGKKAALKEAAETAKFEILLFTDCDCLPEANWLRSYNHFFAQETAMVIGYSPELSANQFSNFTQIFNAGLYAATTGLGAPFSCSGRNFAIRKKVFQEIGGYGSFKNSIAGDDKQLLNLVKNNNFRIAYNNLSPVHTVESDSQLHQQKRRYGKFQQHRFSIKLAAIIVFLFYMFFPYMIISRPENLIFYSGSFLLFWISNLYLHQEKFHLMHLVYFLILPYYMIFFSIWGMFSHWNWKGNN